MFAGAIIRIIRSFTLRNMACITPCLTYTVHLVLVAAATAKKGRVHRQEREGPPKSPKLTSCSAAHANSPGGGHKAQFSMGISPTSEAAAERTEAVPDPDIEGADSSPRPGQELLQERLHMGETSFALEMPQTAAGASTPKPGADSCHAVNMQWSWSSGKLCDHALP